MTYGDGRPGDRSVIAGCEPGSSLSAQTVAFITYFASLARRGCTLVGPPKVLLQVIRPDLAQHFFGFFETGARANLMIPYLTHSTAYCYDCHLQWFVINAPILGSRAVFRVLNATEA